ncbi:MAG: hypothetical protein IIA02_10795 [Proteobacteria bacterium]|nr:hypothetical protein [Pseudomonadota bacterium]
MDTSLDHFDAEDLALIEALGEGEQGSGDGTGQDATNTDQQAGTQQGASSEQGAKAGTDTTTKTDDGQGAAAGQEPGAQAGAHAGTQTEVQTEQASNDGNVKAALRAARRSERRALQESDRLKRELDELKASIPAGAAGADGELDEALAQDFPQIAAALKKRDQLIAQLNERVKAADQAAASSTASAEFVPPLQPPEVQDVIDEVPLLLDMQHNPDQTGWKLAIGYDAVLLNSPKWANRTPSERFAEAARLAHAELNPGTSTAQSTTDAAPTAAQQAEAARQKAAQAAAAAGRRTPETLSDFGGAASESQGSNLARFSKMSDADIEAELLRGG